MNDLERFKAIVHFEKPDYVPIFGFSGAPGMSGGACSALAHKRLVEGGMPEWVDGIRGFGQQYTTDKWCRYWGTTGPLYLDFFPAEPAKGIKSERCVEGEYEIIEYETGAITRQVIDNDITYSMPEFEIYPVRDRKSWDFYRDRITPGSLWSSDKIDRECLRFDERDKPLSIGGGSTWGFLRSIMGTEKACTVLYDDPALSHEIMEWQDWCMETYQFPLIERLRPEIIGTGEDCCYNHGMLISPGQFREFCSSHYRKLGRIAKDCSVDMLTIDTDGNAMELVPLVEECGVNSIHPFEVKAGNNLFILREQHPEFILMGWLEKEVVNEGNGYLIEQEILSKVPPLLKKGGYFPNGDHGIQPLVTFENLCKFMTLLHEVTGNPEGEFPGIKI